MSHPFTVSDLPRIELESILPKKYLCASGHGIVKSVTCVTTFRNNAQLQAGLDEGQLISLSLLIHSLGTFCPYEWGVKRVQTPLQTRKSLQGLPKDAMSLLYIHSFRLMIKRLKVGIRTTQHKPPREGHKRSKGIRSRLSHDSLWP